MKPTRGQIAVQQVDIKCTAPAWWRGYCAALRCYHRALLPGASWVDPIRWKSDAAKCWQNLADLFRGSVSEWMSSRDPLNGSCSGWWPPNSGEKGHQLNHLEGAGLIYLFAFWSCLERNLFLLYVQRGLTGTTLWEIWIMWVLGIDILHMILGNNI